MQHEEAPLCLFSWAIQQYKAQHASFLLFFSFLSRPFPSSASRVYKYIVTHHWARFSSGKKKKRERELRRSFFCVQLNEMMNATFSSLRYRLFLLPAVGYTTDTYLQFIYRTHKRLLLLFHFFFATSCRLVGSRLFFFFHHFQNQHRKKKEKKNDDVSIFTSVGNFE